MSYTDDAVGKALETVLASPRTDEGRADMLEDLLWSEASWAVVKGHPWAPFVERAVRTALREEFMDAFVEAERADWGENDG